MKHLLSLAALAVACVAPSLTPGSAVAAAPVKTIETVVTASAVFTADIAGVQTDVSINVGDFAFSGPEGTFEGSNMSVEIQQIDLGNPRNPRDDEFHDFIGFADLAPEQFQVIGNLETAELHAVVTICESKLTAPPGPPICFEATLDLAWTGEGAVSTSSGKTISRVDGCRIHRTFSDAFRFATAGGTVLADSTNFTPNPSAKAGIETHASEERVSC